MTLSVVFFFLFLVFMLVMGRMDYDYLYNNDEV